MKVIILLLCCAFPPQGMGAEDKAWYFVRHFEKLQGEDPGLSDAGGQRAIKLAEFFTDIPLSQIYSTDYKRSQQTAAPVADKLALAVLCYDPRKLAQLADKLRLSNHVLVIGHSNTTPQLITLMGGSAKPMSELDYGQIFIVSKIEGEIATQVMDISL
jgi:phosphohistidine phosphatase SixA